MQQLDALSIPLAGHNLIQASAGTGKTYTISLLYLRLLIELDLSVDKLLVVTYTRAATAELRERILQRLRVAVRVYEGVTKPVDEYADLLILYPVTPERLLTLRRALLNFDEAAIFTIHGFCQRALQENAFEVGLPFESELIADEYELLLSLADSFWQRHLLQPKPLYVHLLREQKLTPDSLLATVQKFVGKPYLRIKHPELLADDALTVLEVEVAKVWKAIAECWKAEETNIVQLILQAGLHGNSYKEALVRRSALALSQAIVGVRTDDINKDLMRFTPSHLEKNKTGKTKFVPEHALFQQIETVLALEERYQLTLSTALDQLHYELLLWLREYLPQRKLYAGLLAFDDLLVNLQQALQQRESLANQLVDCYQVALIDEFQDTDPVQYDVFRVMYAKRGILFFVGDPKQAIYSFRGADIYTYLWAAENVDHAQHYTLNQNFRSTPALLSAFNTLFQCSPDPFRNQGRVLYEVVHAGRNDQHALQADGFTAPLRFWEWAEEGLSANGLKSHIAQAVANDIAQLLNAGQQGTALLAGQAVRSKDIAILVRSHHEGGLMKQALQACGIVSVQQSRLSIFATSETEQVRIVLEAIAHPANTTKLQRALVSPLVGGNAETLLRLEAEPAFLELLVEQFSRWHQLWLKQGFMLMWQDWLHNKNWIVADGQWTQQQYVLSFLDGERRLTNLLHIAELLHQEIRQSNRGIASALRWLLQQQQAAEVQEELQLRLESDEDLVQIVTIHKSKGLQYPIVYCPFLWADGQREPKGWFDWYDEETRQSWLQASAEGREAAQLRHQAEQNSEALRLLYVAVTRAQYHCTIAVPTGKIERFNYDTPLYWLLYSHLANAEALLGTLSTMKAEQRQASFQQHLRTLVLGSKGTISCDPLPQGEVVPFVEQYGQAEVYPRLFAGYIPNTQRVGSFSALTRGTDDELPDYDGWVLSSTVAVPVLDFGVFPAGATAGVCLHKMLECLDFTIPLSQQTEQIEQSLTQYGFDGRYQMAVTQLLAQTLYAPLRIGAGDFCLGRLPKTQRLDELEFYFPVQELQLGRLQRVLLKHLTAPLWQEAVRALHFKSLQGFMKGFIDLVFEEGGRYYVVDYKSNRLGDAASDYHQARMEQAMAEAHYYLQYLIYCVALRRYLGLRLADLDWDVHFGGVVYLFLRGMREGDSEGYGVYFTRPSVALVEELERVLVGDSSV